jgi:nitrogen-specific signal transduction histidine kinase
VGLGLSIAHALAAAHGGALTLEANGADTGVVEFRLMLPPPGRTDPNASPRAAQPGRPPSARLQLAET